MSTPPMPDPARTPDPQEAMVEIAANAIRNRFTMRLLSLATLYAETAIHALHAAGYTIAPPADRQGDVDIDPVPVPTPDAHAALLHLYGTHQALDAWLVERIETLDTYDRMLLMAALIPEEELRHARDYLEALARPAEGG